MARKTKTPFSKETIRLRRSFPKGKAVGIIILLVIQILALFLAIIFNPQPKDKIDSYELTVTPQSDGTLNIDYRFTWTALDTSEDLTWLDIGMANESFTFIKDSFSNTVVAYERYIDGDYVSARLYLDRPYKGGETVTFFFSVNQADMLCKDEDGFFYEFVPCWFNETPVESYRFKWNNTPLPLSSNAPLSDNSYQIWQGNLPCGSYVSMQTFFTPDAFPGASTVKYEEFCGDAYDSLAGDKAAALVFAIVLVLILLSVQIYMVDSVVSYHRGRGFLSGYGHHIHIYGRSNPRYIKERDDHAARGSGRSGGGGCACACACACAGGGRAGCSQKDIGAFPITRATDDTDR